MAKIVILGTGGFGTSLADDISIQMMATDLTLPPQKLIIKRAEKKGLYQALDIASIWLDRECGAAN